MGMGKVAVEKDKQRFSDKMWMIENVGLFENKLFGTNKFLETVYTYIYTD